MVFYREQEEKGLKEVVAPEDHFLAFFIVFCRYVLAETPKRNKELYPRTRRKTALNSRLFFGFAHFLPALASNKNVKLSTQKRNAI